MQRYSLTRSGVCDCMYKDTNGKWVLFEEANALLAERDAEMQDLKDSCLHTQFALADTEALLLATEERNASLREGVGRLNKEIHALRHTINGLQICSSDEAPSIIRKQAARECLKWMIQNRCISETQANNFCCNFELQEGEE